MRIAILFPRVEPDYLQSIAREVEHATGVPLAVIPRKEGGHLLVCEKVFASYAVASVEMKKVRANLDEYVGGVFEFYIEPAEGKEFLSRDAYIDYLEEGFQQA